ncbi:hypothetical protein L6164_016210 [Bauhinia variegata]|uniref:Uncharacterized protein n=1 Tax=Bauhinia variegata TaxID=167791 RepID=A0ACB9NPB8_BAUVA|nr:hypothetical protein L6164_016210 [Bauhinia variegata]
MEVSSSLNFFPHISKLLSSIQKPPILSAILYLPPSMEREEDKQSPPDKNPYTEYEQVNYDFLLAISLQDQERAFTMFSTNESESEEGESDTSFNDADYDDEAADFFRSQSLEGDLQFLESEGSNEDENEDMEEDEIDPDDLTYEELIELGEFMGAERRGLSANEIPSCLHPYICHSSENKTGIDRCVICQVEYEEGEALVALECEHPYHADCISKWLKIKKACPICSSEISSPKMAKNLPHVRP